MKKYTLPSGVASYCVSDCDSVSFRLPSGNAGLTNALKEALVELEKLKERDTKAHRLISTGKYVAVRRDWVKKLKRLHNMLWNPSGWIGIIRLSKPVYGRAILDTISEVHKDPELFVGGDNGSVY